MTKAAEQCREFIEANWPETPIGRFSCRNTASGGISQHSAYLGYDSNALDIFGPGHTSGPEDTAWIQSIVDTLQPELAKWSGRKILWQQKDHYDHAHIDFYPMITMKKWCGGPETPAWKLSNGSLVHSRDPQPENGLYNGDGSEPIPPPAIPPGDDEDMKDYIEAQQQNLNAAGFRDQNGNPLVVDGVYGSKTKFAEGSRDTAAASSDGGSMPHSHSISGQTGQA
jgi:hypothetical protein